MRVCSVITPARRAARTVNGLIVEPGGNALLNATSELTTAFMRPVCGSRTTMAPSRAPSMFWATACNCVIRSGACAGALVECAKEKKERMRKAGIKVRRASPGRGFLASRNMDRIMFIDVLVEYAFRTWRWVWESTPISLRFPLRSLRLCVRNPRERCRSISHAKAQRTQRKTQRKRLLQIPALAGRLLRLLTR